MKDRITPDNITDLKENEVFVFGANEAGRHGLGAAKTALKWGAKWGQGNGLHGQTYAIPTKDKNIHTLPIEDIKAYVDEFIAFAKKNSNLIFLLTPIGTNLAGYSYEDIAPLFADAIDVPNIHLPARFWKILLK